MGFQIDKSGVREAKPKLSANKEQLLRSELVVYLDIYRRGEKRCWGMLLDERSDYLIW